MDVTDEMDISTKLVNSPLAGPSFSKADLNDDSDDQSDESDEENSGNKT